MTIGVIISLISISVVIIGHICSFAYIQGKNANRLEVLEADKKRQEDFSDRINKIEKDIVEIKTTLQFICDKI